MKKLTLIATAVAATISASSFASSDSLHYRLKNTDAGSHPYIQDIFSEQRVTRNRLPFGVKYCLKYISAQAPINPDIRVFVNYDRGHVAMQKLANCFALRSGFSVEIMISPSDEDMPQAFAKMSAEGNAPDVVFLAHDRAGEWAEQGYLRKINPSRKVFNSVPVQSWESAKIDGDYYGYPVAMESGALIYNKALLPTPPATFEELSGLTMANGETVIEWDYANTYFSMGLLHANGGFAFAQTDLGWDSTNVGVNNTGSVTGLQTIKDLIDAGVLDVNANYGSMMTGFINGQVGAIINGPWAWKDIEEAGIDFGVAPLPSVAGAPASPFVGVTTYLFSADSQYPRTSERFVSRYLMSEEGIAMIDTEWPLGGTLNISYVLSDDINPLILDSLQAAKAGTQMPNVAGMGAFWDSMSPAIKSAATGEKTPQQALDDAAAEIDLAL